MKYLKIWTNFRELIEPLNKEEKGTLFDAMLNYAETGEIPELEGNERFLFPVAKQMIDMACEKNESLRQNGLKGGRPKTKQNQTEPNETNENQTEPEKAYKEKKRKEIESKDNIIPSLPPLLDDDEAHRIQGDHDKVLDAAQNAGINLNRIVTARLIDLYGQYGLEKMLGAIETCARYAAPNLAYLEAVLKGSPKKAKPKVNAQDYDQRSYEEVSDEIMADQIREMEEWLKQSG